MTYRAELAELELGLGKRMMKGRCPWEVMVDPLSERFPSAD